MNLEERIKAGMLFYESGHVDPVSYTHLDVYKRQQSSYEYPD